MDKNVKIDVETHRRLSLRAADMQVKKSELASTLIRYALAVLSNKAAEELMEKNVTSYDNS